MDHVRELQGRLFAVAIAFVVFAAAAYPFFDKIVNFLLAPLGKEQQLVYLTPGGAFSFIIQVCMYVGFVFALPVIIYNIYRFIMPVMNKVTLKMALIYTVSSLVLAIAGMLFAYYVSLPAALYFLTSFNLYHINPMLTVDSYFSFIMTYMIVGALLFQIPLVMLLINGVTPLTPKKLMHHQGKIILGSFIVAAVVSPTPDALNQTLLASPMIVMYQIGVILVWLRNRQVRRKKANMFDAIDTEEMVINELATQPSLVTAETRAPRPLVQPVVSQPVSHKPPVTLPIQQRAQHPGRSVDGFASSRRNIPQRPLPQLARTSDLTTPRHTQTSRPSVGAIAPRRSLDGFIVSKSAI